jgi:hypothetical protein
MAKKAQLDAVRPTLEAVDKAAEVVEAVLDNVDKVADKGAEAVEAGLETVADVVPDALDTAVHVSTKGGRKLAVFLRDPKKLAISAVVLAALAGAGLGVAGYSLAVRRLKAKMQKEFDIQLESEIAEMRRQFVLYRKDGEFSTPASAAETLLPEGVQATLRSYRKENGQQEEVKVEGPPVVHMGDELSAEDQAEVLRQSGFTEAQIGEALGEDHVDISALREKMASGVPVEVTDTGSNIFMDGRPVEDFDYAAEVAKRDPETPYVITHDEFMENENGWTQQSLTYYNGDDTLADDQDMPIPDIEAIVDSGNLSKFGYGSRDKNVVYVRNEKIETDFEITLSQGEFSKEVGGLTELRHSAPVRRFRGDDE